MRPRKAVSVTQHSYCISLCVADDFWLDWSVVFPGLNSNFGLLLNKQFDCFFWCSSNVSCYTNIPCLVTWPNSLSRTIFWNKIANPVNKIERFNFWMQNLVRSSIISVPSGFWLIRGEFTVLAPLRFHSRSNLIFDVTLQNKNAVSPGGTVSSAGASITGGCSSTSRKTDASSGLGCPQVKARNKIGVTSFNAVFCRQK